MQTKDEIERTEVIGQVKDEKKKDEIIENKIEYYKYVANKKVGMVQEFQIKANDQRIIEVQEEPTDHRLEKLNEDVTGVVVVHQNDIVRRLNCNLVSLEGTFLEIYSVVEVGRHEDSKSIFSYGVQEKVEVKENIDASLV
jgi:hypothetical protein